MPKERAIRRPDIELEGIVTCVPDNWKGFFVSDATGGVYCEPASTEAEESFWPVTVGERVVLHGRISEGRLNSFVLVDRVIARKPDELPSPSTIRLDELDREVQDADLVSVRGTMVRMVNIAGEMSYGLVADGIEVDVLHAGFRVDPKLPIHTEVEIRGVVIPMDDNNPIKIVVPNRASFRVLRSQEQLYADTPIERIESIVEHANTGHLVRFRANVLRESGLQAWLNDGDFGIEWHGKLDLTENKQAALEFAGFLNSQKGKLYIEHGNILGPANLSEQNLHSHSTIKLVDAKLSNRIITAKGALIDRHTIDGTNFLTLDSPNGRWTVNTGNASESDPSLATLTFGATYAVTGLVTSYTNDPLDHGMVVGNNNDIRYLAAPPLSPTYRLAFAILISLALTIGLCASLISYRQLKHVNHQVEIAQNELRLANESLESKIASRTNELQSLNQALVVAERKANEANEAKSAFLANMSHEIRTPMTAILGFTEILREGSELDEADRQGFLDTIQRNGDHLLSVIDDILDLAKIESGKMSMHCEAVDPAHLIQEVIALLQIRATEKSLRIEFIPSPGVPQKIWTDPTRFRQILLNLVGNAIKFSDQGKISIELGIELSEMDKVCIEVVDSGIGIREEHQSRIFNAFEQFDNTSTRPHGGTGLGLSICKKLVHLLNGEISVHSQPGIGSRFKIVLPVGANHFAQESTEPVSSTTNHGAPTLELQNLRVLVAEDGIDNQRLIAYHLKRAGATIHMVENGLQMIEALCGSIDEDMIAPCRYDLIVTDMQMPVMDGYTSVAQLRTKGCHLPIIALTAYAMIEDVNKCIEAGCDTYLPKPIDRSALLSSCALLGKKSKNTSVGTSTV